MLPREAALTLAMARVLGDAVKDGRTRAATAVGEGMDAGDRLTVKLPSGATLGTVTMNQPRSGAKVVDDAALLAWVRQTHPSEITETVRPGFLTKLLTAAREHGEPVDTTGEVIPGVEVTQGDPSPSVRLSSDARELVAEAWQRGELIQLTGLLRGEIAEEQQ